MENNAVIKIDLNNIETSSSQPQFKKLISDGWNVVSYLPVEDDGPKLILILSPPRKEIITFKGYMFMDIIVVILLFSILLQGFLNG